MAEVATGFYGKLPCRGDFMQRRVPQDFVDVWDAWLQESLQASRRELGEAWLDIYLTSPVWRFVLAENICGGHGYAGVMLPSVDRVGRYFPLTLVSPLDVGSCVLEVACGVGRPWFDAAESLALAALEASDLDLESFDASVEALRGLASHVDLARSGELMELMASADFTRDAPGWHVSMLGDTPQRAVNAFATLALQRAFRPCALWWTQGSDAMAAGWLVTRGLPPPTSFTALLSGQWHRSGWKSIEVEVASNTGLASGADCGAAPPHETGNVARPAPETGLAAEHPPLMDIVAPLPEVPEIAAVHPQPLRVPGEAPEPRFVTRPEIGLWGVAWARGATAAGGSASRADADLVADLAYNASPQADLTALVEETRRSLQRVIEAPGGATPSADGSVGLVFFLAQGAECALVWSGAMRAFRIRSGSAIPLIDEAPATVLQPGPDAVTVNAGGDSLLALVTPSADAARAVGSAIGVRYERLHAGDLWVLGAASAVGDADIDRVAAAARDRANGGEGTYGEGALESLLAECVPDPSARGSAPPLMLLAARIAAPSA